MANDQKHIALEIWYRLSKAYNCCKKVQVRKLFDENLTFSEFKVLKVLNNSGPVSLKKLRQELLVTTTDMTNVMDNLEKAGYVQRIYSKKDRRVIHAELTISGKNKIESVMPKYLDDISKMYSVLNQQEQKELIRLLNKLIAE